MKENKNKKNSQTKDRKKKTRKKTLKEYKKHAKETMRQKMIITNKKSRIYQNFFRGNLEKKNKLPLGCLDFGGETRGGQTHTVRQST